MNISSLNRELGNSDLILIDYILKDTFLEGSRILDAGCGEGRNLDYFLLHDFKMYGIDINHSALRMLNFAKRLSGNNFKSENFKIGDLINIPFEDSFFDYILCFNVLHFSESMIFFEKKLNEMIRTLKANGILFIGMDSVFGFENKIISMGDGKFKLPNGTVRFLLTEEILNSIALSDRMELIDPVKTLMIYDQESLSYLTIRKVR